MLTISNANIHISRGNSADIEITPIDASTGLPIVLQEGDKVLFTVSDKNEKTVVQKVLTAADYSDPEDTSLNMTLDPDDTINLTKGQYRYDCLLLGAGGNADTFISAWFMIEEALGTYKDVNSNMHPTGGDEEENTDDNNTDDNGGDDNA